MPQRRIGSSIPTRWASSARRSCAAGSATTTRPCFVPELRAGALVLLVAALGALAPQLGTRYAHTLLLDLGPNDFDYVRGFREDWERDGRTRFHWTTPVASISLPIRLAGEGFVLRMRVRRHFVEPAQVTVFSDGRIVHRFTIQADTKTPYRVEVVPLPAMSGARPFQLVLQSRSAHPQPLGVAIDWLEIDGARGAHVIPIASTVASSALAVAVAFVLPLIFRARGIALAHASALIVAITWGSRSAPLAVERILREGAVCYAVVGGIAALVLLAARRRASLTAPVLAGLAVIVLVGLAIRLSLLLHPQFFYPDVRVHAVFARALARQGIVAFLHDFTANQFRYSLGLQFENGHWYAFPYPPGFYLVAGTLVRWAGYVPEVAVSNTGAAINALATLVVFATARSFGLGAGTALLSAGAVPLLPLFITRLSLAYFPALAGQFLDACVVLFYLRHRRRFSKPASILGLTLLIALALLTYTQSLVNLGLLLPGVFVLDFFDRQLAPRARWGLALGGGLGVVLAFALFYGRYVPVFVGMQRGEPMAGEQIVLDKIEQRERARLASGEEPQPESDDPFVGRDVDLLRGMRKAVWRGWLFYGPYLLPFAAGLLLLMRRTEAAPRRFLAWWLAVYFLLNLGSAGLPGPNLLRYNKDLEVIAVLCCCALAVTGVWLWNRVRWLGVAYSASFIVYGAWRALQAFEARVWLER